MGIVRAISSQLLHYCSFAFHASSPIDSNAPGIMSACAYVCVWANEWVGGWVYLHDSCLPSTRTSFFAFVMCRKLVMIFVRGTF